MKIIFLVSSLTSGGAERVAITLSNAWIARGDKVTLIPTFSGRGEPFYEISDGIELIYLADATQLQRVNPKNLLGYAKRLYTLRKLISERRPNVIISFLPNVNVAAILSTAGLGIPLIICERSDPTVHPTTLFWKVLCNATYRFADMLTVQTESVADRIFALYSGIKKVRVVPNPLPEEISSIKVNSNSNRKIVLSMGRLSSEKQIDKTIDAFLALANSYPDWDLHIYGEGPLLATLNSQIEQRDMQGRVFLKGTTNEPWTIMAGADAFMLTSGYEGFPNALLEAMGVGLPCVAFDCLSGPREITRNGKDGLLVELNDQQGLISALSKIMGNDNLRSELGCQARASVLSRYRLSSVITSWDRLFKEVGVVT